MIMCLLHHIGGGFNHQPEQLTDRLSQRSSDLIKRAFDHIDPQRLVDHHVHVAGLGVGGTNAFVNRKMLSWAHPFQRLKFKVYLSSAGVDAEQHADSQFVQRLANLVRQIDNHGKHRLLGFDKNYGPDGSVNLEKTEFYVPNEYVFKLSHDYPDLFLPNISVNPYRITETERHSLKEIYHYNPLLFDFVLKRTLKFPGTESRLPASVFMTNPALGV
jgi:hypothetical protein